MIMEVTPARLVFRWAQQGRPQRYSEIFSAATVLEFVEQGMDAARHLGLCNQYPMRLTCLHLTQKPMMGVKETLSEWKVPKLANGADVRSWPHDETALRSLLAELAPQILQAAAVALINPARLRPVSE